MKTRLAIPVGCASLCLLSNVALAHHSFASFDMTKTIQVTGTVKEFHWTNPHSTIVLETVDANGHTVDAILESNGPGYLVRQGWKRETVRPGDKITATLHPMRDGSAGGNLTAITLADGRQFSAQPTGPRPNTYEGSPGAKDAK